MFNKKKQHIKIDREAFNELVRGKVATIKTTEGKEVDVIFDNVGYDVLYADLGTAYAEFKSRYREG